MGIRRKDALRSAPIYIYNISTSYIFFLSVSPSSRRLVFVFHESTNESHDAPRMAFGPRRAMSINMLSIASRTQ